MVGVPKGELQTQHQLLSLIAQTLEAPTPTYEEARQSIQGRPDKLDVRLLNLCLAHDLTQHLDARDNLHLRAANLLNDLKTKPPLNELDLPEAQAHG